MGSEYGLDFGAVWRMLSAASDVLTGLSFIAIFLALTVLALRRDSAKTRGALLFVALFFLFAGVDKVLEVTGFEPLRGWWNFITAALSIGAAAIIIGGLPRFLRMPRIAEELRGQAGALEEQQSLLQAIQDSVSDGIMLIGEDGKIKAFNAAALRILWSAGEQPSKTVAEMREAAIKALDQGQAGEDVVRWDGRPIERFSTTVEGYGKLYVFRDITSRRQLEEQRLRLERVITSMKEGFAIVSFDKLTIVSTNPAMEQMFGYEPGELAGRPFSELQAGADAARKDAVDAIVKAVAREGFWEGETRNRRKDGGELIAHTTVSLVREGARAIRNTSPASRWTSRTRSGFARRRRICSSSSWRRSAWRAWAG
jgi:PAS domain S-box-containing protein